MRHEDLVIGRQYAIRESQWHEADRALLLDTSGRYRGHQFGAEWLPTTSVRKRMLFAIIRDDYTGEVGHTIIDVQRDFMPDYVTRYVNVNGQHINAEWEAHVVGKAQAREEAARSRRELEAALDAHNTKLVRRGNQLGVYAKIPRAIHAPAGQAPKVTLDTTEFEHLLDLAEGRKSWTPATVSPQSSASPSP